MYKKVKKLTESDKAYIAGIMDGEGTVTLSRIHKIDKRQLVIYINNTELELVEWILKTVGAGKINKKNPKKNHSLSYTYVLTNRQALDLLTQIYPYLKSYKKQRAKLVIEKYKELTPRNGRYSYEIEQEREKFSDEFFKINKISLLK